MEHLISGQWAFLLILVAGGASLYLAINIGANDLANAMGTSVGSGALSLRRAVIYSMLFNLLGALLAGGHVTGTIRKGIVDPMLFSPMPDNLALGMLASLLAAGIWIHLATVWGLPISTTHSIVGAIVGFGILAVGPKAINWSKMLHIVLSWIISPIAGATVAGFIYWLVRRMVLRAEDSFGAAKRYAPFLFAAVWWVAVFSVFYEGLKTIGLRLTLTGTLLLSFSFAASAFVVAKAFLILKARDPGSWLSKQDPGHVDKLFGYLQVITACYVAFAHGSNDVANAVGPFASIHWILTTRSVTTQVETQWWMLAIGGIAIGGGLFFFGINVMETIGKRITEVTKVRGFCAEFGAATTILACSRLGLPVSTTHVLVGAVIGVGFMRGMGALDLRVILNVISSWFLTIPFTTIVSLILYWFFTKLL